MWQFSNYCVGVFLPVQNYFEAIGQPNF